MDIQLTSADWIPIGNPVCDIKLQTLIETELSPQSWPSSLEHYCRKLDVPGFLVYPEGPIQRHARLGWKVPSGSFFRGLLLDWPAEGVSVAGRISPV